MVAHAIVPLRLFAVVLRTVAPPQGPKAFNPSPSRYEARRRLNTSPGIASSSSSPPPSEPYSPTFSDWPKCPHPTPYDVLHHPQNASYTKAHFYHLVKIYHPDLHCSSTPPASSSCSHITIISSSTRLERYRLVIQAHAILSNPAKRRDYDATGAYWHTHGQNASIYPSHMTAAQRYEAWQRGPYASCARNATWEDWERWHERQAGDETSQQEGHFMSNGVFVALVASTVLVASVVQGLQLENHQANVSENRRRRRAEIGDSLGREQDELFRLGREERIVKFMKQRENLTYRFDPRRFDNKKEDQTGKEL